MALFLVAKEDMVGKLFARTGVLILYTGEEVVQLLVQAGFRRARFETRGIKMIGTGICALAEK